jgi:hypothetical protein
MVRGACDELCPQLKLAESRAPALTTSAPLKLAARTAKVAQHSTRKNGDGAAAIAVAAVSFDGRVWRARRG